MSQAEPQPIDTEATDNRSGCPPIHPLAALLLLVVDNLWSLGDWAVFAWIVIIPLSFLSVFFPGLFLQRYANRDGWGKSTGKALMLATMAAVPTAVLGTPVGVAFLAWAGVDKWRSGRKAMDMAVDAVSGATKPAVAQVIDVPAEVSSAVPVSKPPEAEVLPPAATPVEPPPQAHYFMPPPQKTSKVSVLLLCILLVALCFTAGFLILKYAADKVEGLAGKVGNLPGLFKQRDPLNEVFTASLPELSRTMGGKLEIASFKMTEVFERTDFEDFVIPLGETRSTIRVPVTYTYHIELHDPWALDVTNGICYVTAPPLKHNVPAIHTDGLVKRVESDFLTRFKPGLDPQRRMDEFEKTLTPRMWVNAGSPKYVAIVREDCRKTVGEFVRDWILMDDRYESYDIDTLKIVFPDEVGKEEARSLPTLIIRKDQ
jgi:hypothetical protein